MIAGRRLMLSSLAAVATLVLVPAAAGAANRYASPTGTGTNPCDVATLAGACPIGTAVNGAVPGDDITLLGGVPPSAPYAYSASVSLDLPTGATVHGAPGARPVINFSSPVGTDGFFLHDDTSTLRDVVLNSAVQSTSPVDALAGRVERVTSHLSAATGDTNYACTAGTHAVFRDSVCWYDGPDDGVTHNNSALAAFAQVPTDTVTLRNVTLYSNATGLNSVSQLGWAMAVSATNVVAHGGFTDVKTSDYTLAGGPHIHTVALDHSNFLTATELTADDISDPGSGTNQTGPLGFADAATGDFHETTGSTGTLDLGTATGLLGGELDLDGLPRSHGAAPDIGAYEFVPPAPPLGGYISGGTPGAPAGTSPAPTNAPTKKKCKKKKHRAAGAKKCKKKKA